MSWPATERRHAESAREDSDAFGSVEARRLVGLVESLKIAYGHERSFKIREGTLLDNRFLLSIATAALTSQSDERILDLCRRLDMPPACLEATARSLPAARFVHFGFEEDGAGRVYKLYFESDVRRVPCDASPVLLHVALKWAVSAEMRHVVTRYVWHPSLSMQAIQRRLREVYGHGAHEESLSIALGVLELAGGRGPEAGVRYLEVTEDGNERRSFDLNAYDAGLQIQDLSSWLSRVCRAHAIPAARFDPLYEQIKTCRFGHLAGGIHRDGRDFFNVYYGVERRHG